MRISNYQLNNQLQNVNFASGSKRQVEIPLVALVQKASGSKQNTDVATLQARLAVHLGTAKAIKNDLQAGKIKVGIIAKTREMTKHLEQARKIQAALKALEKAKEK